MEENESRQWPVYIPVRFFCVRLFCPYIFYTASFLPGDVFAIQYR